MLALLDRLSGGRLDANLGWTLKEWENRYSGVSLNEGIVLTLAEENRYLAEAGPVSLLITRTLAPGVYLLSSDERFEAAEVLRKAGVDIFAQPPAGGIAKNRFGRSFLSDSFLRLGESQGRFIDLNEVPGSLVSKNEAEAIKEKLGLALEKQKLSKQERDELVARIERRLILSEAQLDAASLRYEKLEARGLDYPGKASIAKQAVENGSLLEVIWPVAGGGQSRVVGLAQALEKSGEESILVIKTRLPGRAGDAAPATGRTPKEAKPSEVMVRVPLGKISLLRRIKQSIFGE
jgi:hypothetical protein